MKKNILSMLDIQDEIQEIIDLGITLKKDVKEGKLNYSLENKTMATIFERASTRTRVSFTVLFTCLGGQVMYLTEEDLKINGKKSIDNIALFLSRYVDIIVYRALNKDDLHKLSLYATVPVINGLDRDEHPCQILADLMTIKENKGDLNGLNLTFIGDGNDNLTHSYLLGCSLVGMNTTVISPKEYWPSNHFVEKATKIAESKNKKVHITENIHKIPEADIIVTDTWISLWDLEQREKRLQDFKNYTVNKKIMNMAKPDAIFMHCMPIHYGEEVIKEVAYGPRSVIIDEAENRMWAQMALIVKMLT